MITDIVGLKNNSTPNARINPATSDKQTSLLTELQLKASKMDTQPISIPGTLPVAIASGTITVNIAGLSDENNNQINPAQDDSIVFLRRMVKLMESKATVDSANRKRISMDFFTDNLNSLLSAGTATGTQNSISLIDTTQYATWLPNQWSYYAVKITAGTGAGQIRIITGNTSTTLTLQNPWTTTPDATSVYGIYDLLFAPLDWGVFTGDAGPTNLIDATKNWTADVWQGGNYAVRITNGAGFTQILPIYDNTPTGLIFQNSNPLTYQIGITQNLDTGTATGTQDFPTLVDTSKSWTNSVWANYLVKIIGGTGAGQAQLISDNTSNTLTLLYPWTIAPDSTSVYSICTLPIDCLFSSTVTGYFPDPTIVMDINQNWSTNIYTGYLVVITSGTGAGQYAEIATNTATTLAIYTIWTTLPDATSTYAIYPMPTQQYTICALPASSTDIGMSVSRPRVATGSDSTLGTISSTKIGMIGLYDQRQKFADVSHKVYNDALRRQLTFK